MASIYSGRRPRQSAASPGPFRLAVGRRAMAAWRCRAVALFSLSCLAVWIAPSAPAVTAATAAAAPFTPRLGEWQHVFRAGEEVDGAAVAAFRIPGFVSLEAVSDVLIVVAEARLFTREDVSPCAGLPLVCHWGCHWGCHWVAIAIGFAIGFVIGLPSGLSLGCHWVAIGTGPAPPGQAAPRHFGPRVEPHFHALTAPTPHSRSPQPLRCSTDDRRSTDPTDPQPVITRSPTVPTAAGLQAQARRQALVR